MTRYSMQTIGLLAGLLVASPSAGEEQALTPMPMREVIPASAVTPAQVESLPPARPGKPDENAPFDLAPTPAVASSGETTTIVPEGLDPPEVIEGDVVVTERPPQRPAFPPVRHREAVIEVPDHVGVPYVEMTPPQIIVERVVHQPSFHSAHPFVVVSRTYHVPSQVRHVSPAGVPVRKRVVPAELSEVEIEVDPGFVPGQPVRNFIRARRAAKLLR